MKIRNYIKADHDYVEYICTELADDMFRSNSLFMDALVNVFCRYYIEKEPENCFVAVDDKDHPVGYILCAQDFSVWEEKFTREYLEVSINSAVKMMGQGAIDGLREDAAQYPAHLHINLTEKCQYQGVGTALMDALVAHLRKKKIPGLMLCVATDNEKGQNFYNKYGFTELRRNEQEIALGIKL